MLRMTAFLTFTAVALFAGATACVADEKTPLKPFRSELWQLEYREDEEQREMPLDADADDENSGQGSLFLVELAPAAGALNLGIGSGAIPGDTTIDEVTSEVPLADMQLEAASTMRPSDIEYVPNDWEMRNLGVGTSRRHVEVPTSKGPSITTIMVGLVACIVMIGAMLTGRD